MTLLRYARSSHGQSRTSGSTSSPSRGGLSRSQRRKPPSRSAKKRSAPVREEPPCPSRSLEYATTIIDPPRRSRASYAVMAAMLLGGAAGLGVGFLRAHGGEEPRAAAAEPGTLELMPALDDEIRGASPRLASASRQPATTTSGHTDVKGAKSAGKDVTARSAAAAREPREPSALSSMSPSTSPARAGAGASVALADEPVREVITDRLREHESLSLALSRHSIGIDDINALVAALRGKVDLRGLRAGDVFRLESQEVAAAALAPTAPSATTTTAGSTTPSDTNAAALVLTAFEYSPRRAIGAPVRWRVAKEGDGWQVEKKVTPITTKVVALGGEVSSSLYVALRGLGEGGALVNRFVDVFAWDIDFYRQPKKGDTFKVIVEKQFADGRFVGYGKVLAAEYVNAGEAHRGFAFASKDDKVAGYFDENGRAREKTFLKNPLEIALITSSYGQRFHPILRRQRSHHGVDYGASKGTAFWAVADGVVQEAHYSKSAGNMIVIRHINGYTTEYFHASRFAEGMRPGLKVKQRQVIGYVGSTGRSTGPHLHFGMKKKGNYVDPGKQVFPAANPVPQRYLQEFKQQVGPLLAELEALENV